MHASPREEGTLWDGAVSLGWAPWFALCCPVAGTPFNGRYLGLQVFGMAVPAGSAGCTLFSFLQPLPCAGTKISVHGCWHLAMVPGCHGGPCSPHEGMLPARVMLPRKPSLNFPYVSVMLWGWIGCRHCARGTQRSPLSPSPIPSAKIPHVSMCGPIALCLLPSKISALFLPQVSE